MEEDKKTKKVGLKGSLECRGGSPKLNFHGRLFSELVIPMVGQVDRRSKRSLVQQLDVRSLFFVHVKGENSCCLFFHKSAGL